MRTSRNGEKMHLTSVDELLGLGNTEQSIEIEIEKVHGFKDHPFKVQDDEKMEELIESIGKNGVLSPVLVRGNDRDGYEMISGHRRLHAAKISGLEKVPAFVRNLTDDEATIVMVDSNIQREELLPSEKAFAFKMKMEAMRRQGERTDLTSRQNVEKLTSAEIGESRGISGRQVERFIRLTELLPELLDLVDKKRLQFICAVDISYFDKTIQKWLNEYIRENVVIKPVQITKLREIVSQENIDQDRMICILNESLPGKATSKKVVFNEKKLKRFFPVEYSNKQIEQIIEGLLEQWSRERNENNGI